MKKDINFSIRFFFCLVAFITSVVKAQQISFVEDCSWEELKQLAQKEGKPIFVDVYTSWCIPCKKMAATVFKDSVVVAYMNTHYISIQLDAEKESGHEFFTQFKPVAYPSFYWMDNKGGLLSTKTGYMSAELFLNFCMKSQTESLGQLLAEYNRQWKAGNREDHFVDKYLFEVLPQVYPDSVRPLFNHYLAGLSTEKLQTERIGTLLCRFTRSIENDTIWSTLLKYNEVYSSILPVSLDFGRCMYMNLVRIPMAVRTNEEKFHSYMKLLEKKSFPNKAFYMKLLQIESLIFDGHYNEALKQALAMGAEHKVKRPYLFREIFYTFIIGRFFVDEYSPTNVEKMAILKLAKEAFELTPSKSTVSYLAAAYAKNGDYKKAYEVLAMLPFYKEPTLSNAVYPLLNLSLNP
ncbi:MAG: thioredoxin family protein [Bacteroides sp.]|nr:thioredoxin family protein [Bacteroides sp.]